MFYTLLFVISDSSLRNSKLHEKFLSYVSLSVQFSRSVVSNSLWCHGLQLARPPCPSPIPGVYSNSCPLSQWCHPTISFSYHPLLPSIIPSISTFSNELVLHIRWPKHWSISFNISPSNEYSGLISFRMDWLDLLAVQDSQESSPTPQFKSINSSVLSFPYGPTLTSIHDYCKNQSFDSMDLCCQIMSLLFNTLPRFVKSFLSRASVFQFHGCSHHLQWFWSPRK